MGEFLTDHWNVVAQNASTFVLFGLIVATSTAGITARLLSGALDACRERLALAQENVDRLTGDKNQLLLKLEEHGESINEIKADLAARPRHYFGEGPPPSTGTFRAGDVWYQVESSSPHAPEALAEEQIQVLLAMGIDPDRSYSARELSQTLGMTHVIVAHVLEQLDDTGFVVCHKVGDKPLKYRLDAQGREYVLSRQNQ